MIDARRHMMAIGAGADEERRRARRDIARREAGERALDLDLASCARQVEQTAETLVGRNVGEEVVDIARRPMRASISARSASSRGR